MTTLTSSSGTCTFGTGYPAVIGGTLINAVEHKSLARSLISGDYDAVRRLAEKQCIEGVGFLEVLVSSPELDEVDVLPKACLAAHDASGLPIYIDSTNVSAIRKTLEVFPYKPLLSVSGDVARLEPVLDLARETNCAVICLCMDKKGIPAATAGRIAAGEYIIQRARAIGIPDEDIVIDPLVLAAGVSEPDSMLVTLDALRYFKQEYPLSTCLGIGNAGFCMPEKDTLEMAYLAAAIPAGLDAALMDPPLLSSLGRSGQNLLYASNFLSGRDPYAKKYLTYLRMNNLIKARKHETKE